MTWARAIPPAGPSPTWLIAHPTVLPDLRIRVHSDNAVSGAKIVRELTAAGRPAKLVTFEALAGRPDLLGT